MCYVRGIATESVVVMMRSARILLAVCCCWAVFAVDAAPQTDTYPGDKEYTEKVQKLLRAVRADSMDFPWHDNRKNVTKKQVARELAERHFSGLNPGMGETNARWLACPDLTKAALEAAILNAMTNPSGFGSGSGWRDWHGHHKGTWYDTTQKFWDEAKWAAPSANLLGCQATMMRAAIRAYMIIKKCIGRAVKLASMAGTNRTLNSATYGAGIQKRVAMKTVTLAPTWAFRSPLGLASSLCGLPQKRFS